MNQPSEKEQVYKSKMPTQVIHSINFTFQTHIQVSLPPLFPYQETLTLNAPHPYKKKPLLAAVNAIRNTLQNLVPCKNAQIPSIHPLDSKSQEHEYTTQTNPSPIPRIKYHIPQYLSNTKVLHHHPSLQCFNTVAKRSME